MLGNYTTVTSRVALNSIVSFVNKQVNRKNGTAFRNSAITTRVLYQPRLQHMLEIVRSKVTINVIAFQPY
jgi:hypothetical protein